MSSTLPASVTVCECFARDGLQSMPVRVSTADKIEMIDRVTGAGFAKVEVTSFSHPKLLPQFMISSSEKHNLLNFRATHADAMTEHARIMKRARALGVRVIGCAGTVYGCPVAGDVPLADVVSVVRFYLEEGAHAIMLGDTTGMANPLLVRERVGELRALFPRVEFIAHFHDTRGTGVVNSVAALELGLRFVDTSLGAIGGQPATGAAKYSAGYTGNTCTEDLVALLEEMGVRTGVHVEKMLEAGRRAETILDQRLRSNVIRSGPVLHAPSSPDKEPGRAAQGMPTG